MKLKFIRVICVLLSLCFILTPTVVYAEDSEYKEFLQGDPRWGSYIYGGGTSIAKAGCAITSFSILMAYADPSLRDVNKFNPKICARDYLKFDGDCVYWSPKAGPLKFREDLSFKATSESEACSGIKSALDKGYYVIMWGQPLYSTGQSETHYSPVVGWNSSTNKPILWDVFSGGDTWENFAKGGITSNSIHVYESTVLPSTETLNGASSGESTDLTDEQKEMVQRVIEEWNLKGMPKKSQIADQSETLQLFSSSDLSLAERISMNSIKENMDSRNKTVSQIINITFVALGLVLIVYTLLLVLSSVFDRSNTFLNISLVSIMTLGKIKVVDVEDKITSEMEKEGYIKSKTLYFRCIVLFLFGCLFVSGLIPMLVMKIVYSLV